MHVRENSKQRDLKKYEARRDGKIVVGQSGLVVVHFTPHFCQAEIVYWCLLSQITPFCNKQR